jgi:hypothetical protein
MCTFLSIKDKQNLAIPQFEIKSGIKLTLWSTSSIIEPKRFLYLQGTLAPQEITPGH